ncbi:hypothetical protein [Taylorella equigenitalis]|uniref:hypothetical protein n=1 Tax=Taylorella equigenitalis TaxID=29575 RepID=UPI000416703E|nr:hypothetical protein [Taylorella equigenitalis]ASY38103.1 hypothetical protein CA605_05335 [Taylorella equigenitalis]ASY42519.1 hypothetical protein CA943_05320 [Taylorella equigenitalis]KGK34089.1 membrane protein [Taylorella equigenitalis]RBA26736.1 hypothetical protein DQW13_03505 [Taylorella equigenitalis]
MKLFKQFVFTLCMGAVLGLGLEAYLYAQNIQEYTIRYDSNKMIPAYIKYKNDGSQYSISTKINVPFYDMSFESKGLVHSDRIELKNYKDIRNGKVYASAVVDNGLITYGKEKYPKNSIELNLPVFDLFGLAYQLSYYGELPPSLQYTNGKKLYLMDPVVLNQTSKTVTVDGVNKTEITYKFHGSDNKAIEVKKLEGEQFPRYISYTKDGDKYVFKFDEFVNP